MNNKIEYKARGEGMLIKKSYIIKFLIICILLMSHNVLAFNANPTWLPELYKILINTNKLSKIPYSKFIDLVKISKPEAIFHLCQAAPKGQFSKTLISIAREKNLISPTDMLHAEKELKNFEKYFMSLKDKGVPYAQNKMDNYFMDISKRIANNKPINSTQISNETKQLINGGLAGTRNLKTGILYNAKGYPIFTPVYETKLPSNMLHSSDVEQFKFATRELSNQISKDPNIAKRFTPEQLEQIAQGYKPKGFTWHHHEDTGKLQLVESSIHQATPHKGGRSIWGGGSQYR